MTTSYNTEIYKKLLVDALPGIIESDDENERSVEFVNSLMNKGEENLSPEEHRLLALMVRLIEDYEDITYPMPESSSPVDALRFLMTEHELRQKDLVDIFGTQSIVSEVLNGKRGINKDHARRLAKRFNTSIGVFI